MGVLGEKIGLRGRASLFLEKLHVGNKNTALLTKQNGAPRTYEAFGGSGHGLPSVVDES